MMATTMMAASDRRPRVGAAALASGSALGLLAALVIAATALAVSPSWTRQFGTAAEDAAGAIAADGGGLTVVGTTSGSLAGTLRGYSDAFVRRYDRAGRVLWTRQFGTTGQDSAEDVTADANGLTVVGATDGSFSGAGGTPGVRNVFMRRYTRTGSVLWTRQFGTSRDEDPGGIGASAAGLTVVGTTWGALSGTNALDDADVFVRRYDFGGKVIWTRQFGTAQPDSGNAVAIDSAGFTIGGGTDGNLARTNAGPFTDAFIRRYDLSGHVLWTRQWGQEGDDTVLSLAADGSGITAAGYTHADAYGEQPSQAFIRRYDRTGRLLWSRIFGTANAEIAWGVASDSAGLTVTGYTFGALDGTYRGSFDVFVRRYDRAGNRIWRTQFGTSGADLGIDVAADGTGFTILGHTNGSLAGTNKGELDIFVRRYAP